jgi:N-formylglutamate deformylase
MTDSYTLSEGRAPLLISLPHDGVELPPELQPRLTEAGLRVADTDWHVGRLYEPIARRLGASLLRPRWSRYLIDLNRPADGVPLYPGRRETGLCPLVSFADEALYLPGEAPTVAEVQARVTQYWRPYHDALANELARLRGRFERVLLWEGHSIRSVCPMFFEGRLPDYNLGTAAGHSAAPELASQLLAVLARHPHPHVLDGRFQGGYITRHFGAPAQGVHAVQLELTQASYMDEAPPFPWDADRAAGAQRVISELLAAALMWATAAAGGRAVRTRD